MFWPLQSRSKFSRVPEDSQVPFLGVWVVTSQLPQSGVATTYLLPTYLPTNPPTHLPTYYPLTYPFTYPPTHPPTYSPTHPFTYLPTQSPTYLLHQPTYLPTYLLIPITYPLTTYHPTTCYLLHSLVVIWNKHVK